MSEPAEQAPRPSDAVGVERNPPGRRARALAEGRTEAIVVLALDVALWAGLWSIDQAKGWDILGLGWWAWLLLTSPALLLMILLIAVPHAEMRPGPARNAGMVLLGLLVAAVAVEVGVLLTALVGNGGGKLSAGELFAHGGIVWLTNIITFGLLFWQLDEGGPGARAERGRVDPDFQFPQDDGEHTDWSPWLSDYLYVSLTNAIAVSPTDTMPLTRRAKGVMAAESLIAWAVVILVVSRAVGILGAN